MEGNFLVIFKLVGVRGRKEVEAAVEDGLEDRTTEKMCGNGAVQQSQQRFHAVVATESCSLCICSWS